MTIVGNKRRVVLMALISAIAAASFSAAAASSASAYSWQVGGKTLGIWDTANVTGDGSAVTISATILETPYSVTCYSNTNSGTLEYSNKRSWSINLSDCISATPSKCTSEPISIKAFSSLYSKNGETFELFTGEGEKSRFGQIKLKNCGIAGSYWLQGSFTAQPWQLKSNQHDTEQTTETIPAIAGSELFILKERATMRGFFTQRLETTPWGWVY